jgi:urocanate hydratase
VKTGYCDVMVNNLDEALRILKNAVRKREPASVGLIGNPFEITQEMTSRGIVPDLLANIADSASESASAPQGGTHALHKLGSILLGGIDQSPAADDGATVCFVALSGETADIQRIDRLLLELFPEDESFARRLRILQRRVRYQGLPSRALWLDGEQRKRLGIAVNCLVGQHELKAPVLIGRLAPSFNTVRPQKTNAQGREPSEFAELLQLAGGATWASIHHDDAGKPRVVAAAIVAEGTSEAGERIERVLTQKFPR